MPTRRPQGQQGLLDQGQRQHKPAAAGELWLALLRGQPTRDVLQLIATRARQGATAAVAQVGSSTDGDLLVVQAAARPDEPAPLGQGQPVVCAIPTDRLAVQVIAAAPAAPRTIAVGRSQAVDLRGTDRTRGRSAWAPREV